MEARRIADRILVRAAYAMPHERLLEMVRVIETDCSDHDVFSALPRVVEMGGIVYGLTGWDSDHGVAFYRNDAVTARGRAGP